MMNVHVVWKATSILACVIAAAGLILGAFGPPSPIYWAASTALAFASIGSLQYAYGWPRVPRLVWRVFGPVFSIIMIWPLAETVGWLGTRLAIKQLSLVDWMITATTLTVLTLYTLAIVVPLYRLGDWGNRSAKREDELLRELTDTFA